MEDHNISETTNNKQKSLAENTVSQEGHLEKTAKFISETSLDDMIEIAEIARRKKLTEPPKWVIPDEI